MVFIQTLKEEIKSVVLEKLEIDNHNESTSKTFLAFLDYQNCNSWTELIIFRPNTPEKMNKIIVPLEEMLIVMKKYEFEY